MHSLLNKLGGAAGIFGLGFAMLMYNWHPYAAILAMLVGLGYAVFIPLSHPTAKRNIPDIIRLLIWVMVTCAIVAWASPSIKERLFPPAISQQQDKKSAPAQKEEVQQPATTKPNTTQSESAQKANAKQTKGNGDTRDKARKADKVKGFAPTPSTDTKVSNSPTPITECPPGVPVYSFVGKIEASDNGGCGIRVDGDVCVLVNGQMYLERNRGGGLCVTAPQR